MKDKMMTGAPSLNDATAEQMLRNIFEACGYEPHTVPLEVLNSYSNYRKERYTLQRALILLVLILFLLLPLLFVSSQLLVAKKESIADRNPVFSVDVSGNVPISEIKATINGRTVPIYEAGPHRYTVQPGSNGIMTVTVTLINHQRTDAEVEVQGVDTSEPVILSTAIEEDSVTVFLADEGSGVDPSSITATDAEGRNIEILWDDEAQSLTLPYPDSDVQLSVSDYRGNLFSFNIRLQ